MSERPVDTPTPAPAGTSAAARHDPAPAANADTPTSTPAAPELPPAPPAWRLVLSLGGAGLLAGLLLVFVYEVTLPTILANREARLLAAVQEVLHEPARVEELQLVDGALRPAGDALSDGAERVHAGYDADGALLGYAVSAERPGYQDVIVLLFGYDPRAERLLGMKVLQSKETPGLGDRIETDTAFVAQFDGVAPPLVGLKAGAGGGAHDIEFITGATISSRTLVAAINDALERVGPSLRAAAEGTP